MDLLQLKYFYESAQSGSFSKTAQKHMVPLSSVSASIRRLEKELNCALFDRFPNYIVLNENGKKLQKDKMNPIHNPSIIDAEYTKYKQNMMLNDEHGAYKLLSDKAKKARPQANPYGCYYEDLEKYFYDQSVAFKHGRD